MATHELTLTIKWYPTLVTKTPDAELGTVIAHNFELLCDDAMHIISKEAKKLPPASSQPTRRRR